MSCMLRSVSFVERLELEFHGNHFCHALTLGDVDGDGLDEFIIGNVDGTLAVFKGNGSKKPWRISKGLGTITCAGTGDIFNNGKIQLVCINSAGICHIFSVYSSTPPRSSTSSDSMELQEIQPVHCQPLPPNIKVMLLACIAPDGKDELFVGHTDRVVGVYRWNSELACLELKYRFTLQGQIGSLSVSMTSDGISQVLVSQPGGTYIPLCYIDVLETTEEIDHSLVRERDGSKNWQSDESCTIVGHLSERNSISASVEKEGVDDIHVQNEDIGQQVDCKEIKNGGDDHVYKRERNNSIHSGTNLIQGLEEETRTNGHERRVDEDSKKGRNYENGGNKGKDISENGTVTAGNENPLASSSNTSLKPHVSRSSLSSTSPSIMQHVQLVTNPLVGLVQRGNPTSSTEVIGDLHSKQDLQENGRHSNIVALCTLDGCIRFLKDEKKMWEHQVDRNLFSISKLDITNNGQDEVIVCAWDGTTYLLDDSRNVVKFEFEDNVCAFCAGSFGFSSEHNKPCLIYTTFYNKIYVYHNIFLPSIAPSNLSLALSQQEMSEDLGFIWKTMTDQQKRELLHQILYLKNFHSL